MKVVILCGGEGTRLSEYTRKIPKPLVEVGGKPILWHIMKIYSHYGFNEFVLCLGYKGHEIKKYFKNNKHDWNIEFVDTSNASNKAQRLLKIQKYIKDDDFLVTYGDDVSNVNINKVIDFHFKNKKIVTLSAVPLYSNFGVLELDEDTVVGFKEKPRIKDKWFNGGFFVFNKKIFEYLDRGDLEDEVFKFLAENKQISAFKHNGFWKSMNTFKDVIELNKLWTEDKADWRVWK